MSSIERLGHHEAARTYLQNAEIARAASQPAQAKDADTSGAAAARRTDSVSLSANARSLAAARDAAQSAPEIRHEKVAEIKQRVEDGTYSVPAHVLARKLLEATTP